MSNYLALLNYNLTSVNASTINYSTLIGSTIIASSIVSNSSINVNNIIVQNINYSTLTGSTMTTRTINYSTLTGSTILAQAVNYSTLTGSTMTNNTMVVNSTLTGSTMTVQTVNYSTLTGSTMTNNTMTINSTINVSSITSRAINYSTMTGSTMTINTLVIASTLTVSTLIATNNPAGVITSSMISLGASTNQSYTALAQGNYSTSTNWLSTLTNLSSTKFIAISGNAQTQLAVTQVATVSSIYYTSTVGTSWSTISNVTGLPTATQTNYSCGAVSGNGQYAALGANGNLYVTSTLTSAVGPSFTTVVPNSTNLVAYYQFENNINAIIGPNLTAIGTPSYVNGIVGSKAVYLANTAGTATPSNYLRATLTNITNAISITGWFNLQVGSAIQVIFSTGNNNIVLYTNSSNTVGFNTNGVPVGTTSFAISLNTWYNFTCISQSNGACYFYINNTLIGTVTTSSLPSISTVSFGTYDGALNYGFNGYIDDIRIYNSAITFTPVVSPNWSNVALSNSGQYMLATVANGGLYMSSNFGSTWSQVSAALLQAAWSLLEISSTGQYMSVYSPPVTVTPQFAGITGGATGTWSVNNVTWSVSASTYVNTSYYPTNIFNNSVGSSSWASGSGAYTPSYPSSGTNTVILGVGTIYGDWLQLQSSTPLTMNSYTFMSGGNVTQMPRNYYIVGSNDSTNWYPIQYVVGTTNAATVTFQAFVTYFNVLYTGTQNVTGGQVGSYATTSYATSGNAYTYFRIIPTILWASVSNVEIGEWYINFTAGGQLYSTNFGAMWCNLLPANTSTLALSGSGQYALENINTTTVTTTPQLTGLAGASGTIWNVSGVVWTVTASTTESSTYNPTFAFNNTSASSWASTGLYPGGIYTTGGSAKTTTIGAPYSATYAGEWLQIQSSVPLIMYSCSFGCGDTANNFPRTFFIVGSNDGSTWFPIQLVNMGATNPFSSINTLATTYLLTNYTGTQIFTANTSQSVTTTSYSTSGNAYTYFRIIANTTFGFSNFQLSEWFINFNNVFMQPQLTGLTGVTSGNVVTSWISNNVTWTSSASSIFQAGFQAWLAFNNILELSGNFSWGSFTNYSGGTYNNTYSTTIAAPYSAAYTGEWLQIQSSVPVVLYNYSFACRDVNNFPKTYLIAGSNDGSTWFPIQLVNMGGTSAFSANFSMARTYLLANYTGTQSFNGGNTISVTTTAYSTSSNAYTYFRIIINSVFSNTIAEIGEWFINFTNTLTSPQLTGLSGSTSGNAVTSWTANNSNIIWTSSASSAVSSLQPWVAFNNLAPTTTAGNYSWASAGNYPTGGIYNNANPTTIAAPYSAIYYGEWLQIQSSVPVVMYNYTFGSGAVGNVPKTYLIAGSNDNTTWFPIQLASMATNPLGDFTSATRYLLANYTGNQILTSATVPAGATITTTAYSTSSNAYTYFRIIANTTFGGSNYELTEWFVNFTTTTVSPQLSGLTGNTSSGTPVPTTWAANNIAWTSNASSVYASLFQSWNAFDANNIVQLQSNYGDWNQIQMPTAITANYYQLATRNVSGASQNRYPTSWILAGSNDGSLWRILDTRVNVTSWSSSNTASSTATYNTYAISNPLSYSYYRIIFTQVATAAQGNTYRIIALTAFNLCTGTTVVNSFMTNGLVYPITLTSNTSNGYNLTTTFSTAQDSGSGFLWWLTQNNGQTLGSINVNGLTGFRDVPADNYTGTNNTYAGTATNTPTSNNVSWATSNNTYNTLGSYTGSVSTTISAPYSAAYTGEWIQIQNSVPIVLYNYSFACGSASSIPNTYFIVGSNDGATWYPIQLASIASNPFTANTKATSYLLANYNGSQSLTATTTQTVTTTAYSTSGNAYTYFRLIANTNFGTTLVELQEWFVNFTPTQYVTSNYLSATSSTPYTAPVFSPALTSTNVPITSAASQTGQYMVLITNNASGANVYYSTNYGANFTGLTIGSSTMVSCAISSDGSYITVMNATTVYQLNNNSIGFSVAVGNQAGQQNQAQNAIAIGSFAGQQNQTANSIVLNATGAALNSYVPGFYVAPIAQYNASSSSSFNLLGYGSDNQIVQTAAITISPTTSNPTLQMTGSLTILGNVGIGSTVPQYHLDVAGTARTSVQMFADNSAMVSATPALDYTTFGQNWATVTTPPASPPSWFGTAISASGQYQSVGGYLVSPNSSAYYSFNYGQTWTASTGIPLNRHIYGIAMSSSGQYQVAYASNNDTGIYYSSNYGVSWTLATGTSISWYGICMSSSGQYVSAVTFAAGNVTYYSTNYGVTWTTSASIPVTATIMGGIGCSASGQYQVMGFRGLVNGFYYSSNYGQSWIQSTTSSSVASNVNCVAMSASGQYVTIVTEYTSSTNIWISTNYGITFSSIGISGLPANAILGNAMSASGQYQVVCGGGVYYSTNYGITWVQGLASALSYYRIAMSQNGQYLLFGTNSQGLHQSITRFPPMVVNGNIYPGIDNTYSAGLSGNRFTAVYAVNGTIQTSDSSEKVLNILPYGLNEVLQIKTIMYKWKSQEYLSDIEPAKNFQYYGICADQLSAIFPELVYNEDPNIPMQLNYTELIPVVIKAIQEQQITIQQQAAEITALKSTVAQSIQVQTQVNAQQIQIAELMQRLENAGIA